MSWRVAQMKEVVVNSRCSRVHKMQAPVRTYRFRPEIVICNEASLPIVSYCLRIPHYLYLKKTKQTSLRHSQHIPHLLFI